MLNCIVIGLGGFIGPVLRYLVLGFSALAGIAAAFTEAGIELDDIGLQRPSLDDVFLSLTWRRAEPGPDDQDQSDADAATSTEEARA